MTVVYTGWVKFTLTVAQQRRVTWGSLVCLQWLAQGQRRLASITERAGALMRFSVGSSTGGRTPVWWQLCAVGQSDFKVRLLSVCLYVEPRGAGGLSSASKLSLTPVAHDTLTRARTHHSQSPDPRVGALWQKKLAAMSHCTFVFLYQREIKKTARFTQETVSINRGKINKSESLCSR